MFKVRDSDNIFLLLMKCITITEIEPKSRKIVKQYYKVNCNVCFYTVKSKDEFSAKRAILAHIVSQHKDKWLNHCGDLVEDR